MKLDAVSRIAFVSTRDGMSEIYVMNADGNEQLRLMINPAQDLSPAWSPDGARIAFASNRDGNWEIYTIDDRGGDLRRLTESEGFDGAPSWSPDGTRIAFTSARDGNLEIYVMNADGSAQTRVTTSAKAEDAAPAWAPASPACGSLSGAIAFESDRDGDYEIYAIQPDGSGLENLTDNSVPDFNVSWAPDCSAVAFDRPVGGNYDVFTLALATRTETRLTSALEEDSRPTWSPNSQAVAFTSLRDGHYEIYVMASDGSGQRDISHSFPATDSQPAWSRVGITPRSAPSPAPFTPGRSRAATAGSSGGIQLTCGIGPHARRKVRGTSSADVICSDDPGQELLAGSGRDTIIDSGGRDTVYGGKGRDVIHTRDGARDVITGGPGLDEISSDRFDVVRKPTGDAIAR